MEQSLHDLLAQMADSLVENRGYDDQELKEFLQVMAAVYVARRGLALSKFL